MCYTILDRRRKRCDIWKIPILERLEIRIQKSESELKDFKPMAAANVKILLHIVPQKCIK